MRQLKKNDLEQVAGAATIGKVIVEEGGILNIIVIIPPLVITPPGGITSPDVIPALAAKV